MRTTFANWFGTAHLPSARWLVWVCMVALAGAIPAGRAADPDLSNLDKEAVVKKPAPLTRGWSPKPQGTPRVAQTRSYNATRGVVVIEEVDGTVKELPYVVLPIYFKVDSDSFRDAESEVNVQKMALKLQEPQLRAARFVVEGHTSSEGGLSHNQQLSERRANRIIGLLVSRYGIDPGRLAGRGFGSSAPAVQPELSEQDRELNRRVLIVKEAGYP